MDYQFREIELKWRSFWAENKTFQTSEDFTLPKYYILDMFPYPSGAGLHVGHPLGYIASDILARYKRLQGYNVLHPMGYDAFGLPAEQYAIQTGQHPAVTTAENIKRYREQLDNLGFSYDWSREVRTSDPAYYKWTQWIFIRFFHSWYNLETDRAEPLEDLVARFGNAGNEGVKAAAGDVAAFTSKDWAAYSEAEKERVLMEYRLAFLADSTVNWCAGLGTVLANEEVKDGFSERGGYPVVRKVMRQWFLRITAYAGRLVDDLEELDWSESLKEMQRNWIGRSQGASLRFKVSFGSPIGRTGTIEVFTTRPDTIYGCTFLVLAPEHELVAKITTLAQQEEVSTYILQTTMRSERDRMADVKTVSGAFTGAYATNPFTLQQIPIYITDYVLAGYGTGAVMAVPGGDERDFRFAKGYHLPIIPVIEGFTEADCYTGKVGILKNSGILNGLTIDAALLRIIEEIEARQIGKGKINYRLRDAGFSRQRYWGEPFPVYYRDGIARTLHDSDLPLVLPAVDKYLPTETGEPPLGRAVNWTTDEGYPLETNTMPGWAGSSWYFLRYMDPLNTDTLASASKINYWKNVDFYLGGSEHATGHLLYVRFWTKFLYDLGIIPVNEPARRLVNQGMIQGRSSLIYRLRGTCIYLSATVFEKVNHPGAVAGDTETYSEVSKLIRKIAGDKLYLETGKILNGETFTCEKSIWKFPIQVLHVDVNLVRNDSIDEATFRASRPENANAVFISDTARFMLGAEVEKMSKSRLNVINPDLIVESYGADTLRMYEMFLGPLELAKPWNTNGIEGVFKFLRKFWRLYHDDDATFRLTESVPSREALKSLHKMIRKASEDLEKLSFNTSVSSFMICVNELSALKCSERGILEPLIILLAPYAPHVCEELWQLAGRKPGSLSKASWPQFDAAYLAESSFNYPVSFNGKTRLNLTFALDLDDHELEQALFENAAFKQYLDGRKPRKVIIVRGRIINLVI